MIERTQDNKFEIKRIVKISDDPNQIERLKKIKENNGYDILLKDEKNNLFLLCNEISDAVIIPDKSLTE